jgi:hypothetical protein
MAFIEKESYKHKLSKELLAGWLNELEKNNDGCSFGQFKWRSSYGVHTELKIYENDDPCYFENSEGLFNENFDRGKILFVPDITIFHKGSIKYLIEVVHSNPVSEKKINKIFDFFNRKGQVPYVYEIEAEEILRHTSIPYDLECTRIL